jgi:hypothetical protein
LGDQNFERNQEGEGGRKKLKIKENYYVKGSIKECEPYEKLLDKVLRYR